MTTLTVEGAEFSCTEGETVLSALTRQGIALPFSCKEGVCHCCMVKATQGEPPRQSQYGVKDTLKEQSYFLACQCYPESDMEISITDTGQTYALLTVLSKDALSTNVLRLRLSKPAGFSYRSGQFLNLRVTNELVRSYSIASLPDEDDFLELHIARVPGGRASGWLHDVAAVGSQVEVAGPMGDCFYIQQDPEQALVLIGSGTGLAPLLGIIRDAIRSGHSGPVFLYHGSCFQDGLYLQEELSKLEDEVAGFHYIPCLESPEKVSGLRQGRVGELALSDHKTLAGYRLYICGNPEMVKAAQRGAYLQGASMGDIYSDAFTTNRTMQEPVDSV